MSEQNKATVRRLVDEAQSAGNLAVVDEILAEDFVDSSPFEGVPPTREGVRMLFGALRTAFPDLRVTISEQVAEGDKVVTRKTFRGTQNGPFMALPASGRSVEWEVIDILTFRDRQIVGHRVIFDQLGFLRQLGALG